MKKTIHCSACGGEGHNKRSSACPLKVQRSRLWKKDSGFASSAVKGEATTCKVSTRSEEVCRAAAMEEDLGKIPESGDNSRSFKIPADDRKRSSREIQEESEGSERKKARSDSNEAKPAQDNREEKTEGENDAAAVGTSGAQEDAAAEIHPTRENKGKGKESDLSEEPTDAQDALLKAVDEIGDDVKELASCVQVIKKSKSVKAGFEEYIAHRKRKRYLIPWLKKDPEEFDERMKLFAKNLLYCIDTGTRGPIKVVRAPPFLDRKLDDEPPCGCNADHNPNPN